MLQPITKERFFALGGANNPQLIRRPGPYGQWAYFINTMPANNSQHANRAH